MIMDKVELIYSKERNTWNVFVDNEWYFETENYEEAREVYESFQYRWE